MEAEGSLPYAQEPLTCLVYSPRHSILGKIHSNIILPCTRRAYEWSFSFRIPTKTVYTFTRPSYLPYAQLISFCLVSSSEYCLMYDTNRDEAPHYAVFSSIVLLPPS